MPASTCSIANLAFNTIMIYRILFLLAFVLAACGPSVDEYMTQAREKMGTQQYREAISLLDEVLRASPTRHEAINMRGAAYFSLGEHSKALEDFSKAVALDSSLYKYYYNRGNVLRALNDAGRAIEDYTRAIRLDATHYEVYLNRGLAYLAIRKPIEAMQDFNAAVALTTTPDANLLFYRGRTLLTAEDYPAAIADFSKSLALDSTRAEGWYFLALAHAGADGTPNEQICKMLETALNLGYTDANSALALYCDKK